MIIESFPGRCFDFVPLPSLFVRNSFLFFVLFAGQFHFPIHQDVHDRNARLADPIPQNAVPIFRGTIFKKIPPMFSTTLFEYYRQAENDDKKRPEDMPNPARDNTDIL